MKTERRRVPEARRAHTVFSVKSGGQTSKTAHRRGTQAPTLYSLPPSVRGGLVTFTPGLFPEPPTQAGEESPGRREGRGGGPGLGKRGLRIQAGEGRGPTGGPALPGSGTGPAAAQGGGSGGPLRPRPRGRLSSRRTSQRTAISSTEAPSSSQASAAHSAAASRGHSIAAVRPVAVAVAAAAAAAQVRPPEDPACRAACATA